MSAAATVSPDSPAHPAGHGRAIAFLLLACALWGLSFPLGKLLGDLHARLVPGVGEAERSLAILGARFTLASLLLAFAPGPAWRSFTRAEWRLGLGLAACSGSGLALQFAGMQLIPASTSAFLTQFFIVIIPLWTALHARRAPTLRVWGAITLVAAGVVVLADPDWARLQLGAGEALTLASTGFIAAQVLWLGRAEFAACRGLAVSRVMFSAQGMATGAAAVFIAPPAATYGPLLASGAWWLLMAALTLGSTVGAFTLMNLWQRRLTPTEAGVIYGTEPLFATLFACALPAPLSALAGLDYANERVTGSLLVGGVLITAANVWLQLGRRRA